MTSQLNVRVIENGYSNISSNDCRNNWECCQATSPLPPERTASNINSFAFANAFVVTDSLSETVF